MADLNPMVSGDVPYPQYSVTTTEEIEDAVTISKGVVYTKNAAGNLIVVTTSVADGLFQAKATPETVPAVTGDKVQVLGPRTRMIFTTQAAGLAVGNDVIIVPDTTNVIAGAKTSPLHVGKIFEIYTRNSDSTKKKLTEVDDRVIVESVQA